MHAVVTGGTGYVGRFIVEGLLAAGFDVTVGTRKTSLEGVFSGPVKAVPFALDADAIDACDLTNADVLIHAAFHHEPGRFRGGEGDDPESFRRLNLDGARRLFGRAKQSGVKRCVFLSTRAVYGTQLPGQLLSEDMPVHPDTLYGEVKRDGERHLSALSDTSFVGTSLRVTGVYGSGGSLHSHKWDALVRAYLDGATPSPRIGTEVHGEDVALAVLAVLNADENTVSGEVFNVSDLLLDRHDLFQRIQDMTGVNTPVPARADVSALNVMACEKLMRLGWQPGGLARLHDDVDALLEKIQTDA